MGNNDFNWKLEDAEKEQRRKARKEKWAQREKNFWKVFLFTEDGKPKSGLMVYTFCLSFVFLAIYMAAFHYAIEWLTPVLSGLPVFFSNLIQSLSASVAGLLIGFLLHRVLTDKRLVFGSYLWLALYAVAVCVTMIILLREAEAISLFLTFYSWFVLIPLVLGLAVTYLLYRKDYVAPSPEEEVPAWRKYTQRR